MAYNNNFSNFNSNPYYTPTSFSNITNPVYHNFNQLSVPDWSYPNQYNPYLQSYNHSFHNNFNSSQSQWGFTSLESNFQPTCPPSPPSPQYFQDSYSVPTVQNRKLSILEMSTRESKQKFQNLMDSQFHHQFQNNTSTFQQDDEPINYEKMLEAMTQVQNARNRDIDMMVQFLRSHRLTSSDVTNHSVRAEQSCCFGN